MLNERDPIGHHYEGKNSEALPQHILDLLREAADPNGIDASERSLAKVADFIADKPWAIQAVRSYLSPGGEAYARDFVHASNARNALAWLLIEKLVPKLAGL